VNIVFQDVRELEKDGVPVMLQRGVIPKGEERRFWATWRFQTPPDVKKRYVLRREAQAWAIYRMRPLQAGIAPPSFALSYYLRSTDGLLPYQPVSVQHLCNAIVTHGAAVDGSDTGLGKTYVALAVCRELWLRPAIVCKLAGISAWETACEQFNADPLFIVNWEQAKNGRFRYAHRTRDEYTNKWVYRWKLPGGNLLIFDEAHKANQDGTQNCALYTASKGLASLSLSASLADRMTRLRPLFHLLGIVPWETFPSWIKDYGSFLQELHDDEPIASAMTLSEQQDLAAMQRVIYPAYGYRLSYNDPEVKRWFPDAAYQTEVVNLSSEYTDKMNELYDDLLTLVEHYREKGRQADALVADLRYRQQAELLKVDALVSLARDYLEVGHSVIIFVNFRHTLKYLAKALKTKSVIFGSQERYGSNREEVIRAFQANETRIIVAMAAAGGESISLHDLHGGHPRVSLICPTYDPVILRQVLGRTRRAKSRTVPIMKLVYAARTVEEKVAVVVNSKLGNIAAINDGDLMEPELFNLGIHREETPDD